MRNIVAHNVNQALAEGLRMIGNSGVKNVSRNGPVLRMPEPVCTRYLNPTMRVLFDSRRDANPFFHLMEALWMLAGRNDVAFLKQFVSTFYRYSDDGSTLYGAYGYRWREWFGVDQIQQVVAELRADPLSRRAVLGMWHPGQDLATAADGGKDVPCNTQCYFELQGDHLNMMITCRSNDMYWGAHGANAVHFSVLQEYIAGALGANVGVMDQVSFNYHIYPGVLPLMGNEEELVAGKMRGDPYNLGQRSEEVRKADRYTAEAPPHHGRHEVAHPHPVQVPLMKRRHGYDLMAVFDEDLAKFMACPNLASAQYNEPFFATVAAPMYAAWAAHKEKRYQDAFEHATHIKAGDWRIACTEWFERRAARRAMEEVMED